MQLEVCRQRVQLGASRGFQGFLQDKEKNMLPGGGFWWRSVLCPNCSEEVLSLVWCRAKAEVKDAVSCAALTAVCPSPPSNDAAGVCGLALALHSLGS